MCCSTMLELVLLFKHVSQRLCLVSATLAQGYALANEMEYFETSASSGDNVDEALHHVFRGVVAEHLQRELPPPVE